MYQTHAHPIAAKMPRNLRNKTAQQIIEYLRKNFETEFITDKYSRMQQIPKNEATAYMIAVSQAIFDPDDWKAPIKAWFPTCGEEWAKAAIVWYHGAEPHPYPGYWVYSPGYSC